MGDVKYDRHSDIVPMDNKDICLNISIKNTSIDIQTSSDYQLTSSRATAAKDGTICQISNQNLYAKRHQ